MSDVVNDPSFAQYMPKAIARDAGSFLLGKWNPSITLLDFYGIVQPANSKDIQMVPEGDRVEGMMTFHSSNRIYETHSGDSIPDGISDVITWRNQTYKIMFVYPWEDFGYYRAIGVRMAGK